MTALYDRIGLNYADLRRPDPRIAAPIHAALGDAKSVLNIGAGTGSYEPLDRQVIAIDPSSEMIAQRRHPAAQVIQASAEAIPLPDNHVDAAMGILTLHHWTDQAQGLAEVRRVTRGPIVLLTFDPTFAEAFAALTPGRQKGYYLHIGEAKQSKTRIARIEKLQPRIFAGKGYNER